MENEYISRRKAAASIGRVIADMKEMANGDPVQVAAIGLVERTRYYIETFPVEDVAPVRHGRWIMYIPPMYTGDAVPRCSECGMTSDVKTPFCAQCGAVMEGDGEA